MPPSLCFSQRFSSETGRGWKEKEKRVFTEHGTSLGAPDYFCGEGCVPTGSPKVKGRGCWGLPERGNTKKKRVLCVCNSCYIKRPSGQNFASAEAEFILWKGGRESPAGGDAGGTQHSKAAPCEWIGFCGVGGWGNVPCACRKALLDISWAFRRVTAAQPFPTCHPVPSEANKIRTYCWGGRNESFPI